MKLLVLSTNRYAYGPRKLQTHAAARGWQVELIEYQDLSLHLSSNNFDIYYKNKKLLRPDALVLRAAKSYKHPNYDFTRLRQAVYDYFSDTETFILNRSIFSNYKGIYDKLTQLLILQKAGIPIVKSKLYGGFDFNYKDQTFPLLLKPIEGSHGFGIKKTNSQQSLKRYSATLLPWKTLVQSYIDAVSDYRVMIIGGKVVGVIKREGAYKLGIQNTETVPKFFSQPSDTRIARLALKAVEALDLDYAGVDILEDKNNQLIVLEVNGSAGYKRLDDVISTDTTKILLDYIENTIQT